MKNNKTERRTRNREQRRKIRTVQERGKGKGGIETIKNGECNSSRVSVEEI